MEGYMMIIPRYRVTIGEQHKYLAEYIIKLDGEVRREWVLFDSNNVNFFSSLDEVFEFITKNHEIVIIKPLKRLRRRFSCVGNIFNSLF